MYGSSVLLARSGAPHPNFEGVIGALQGYHASGARLLAQRTDSLTIPQGMPADRIWIDVARRDANARMIQRFIGDNGLKVQAPAGQRQDAFDAGAGLFFARQLEHVYSQVLREPVPERTGFTLFPVDRSVPVGAKTHTVRRLRTSGEAMVYRGAGVPVPRVSLSQVEQEFPVRHYVDGFNYSLWEQLSANFANFAMTAELLRAARLVLLEFANEKIWYGDAVNGIYGVVNYPWLAKYVIATPFDGSADPDDVIAALNALVAYPKDHSKATMNPTRLAVSPRIHTFLFSTPRATGTDTTIGEFFLKSNAAGIKKIDVAHELQGVGPGGTDGALAYRDDSLGIQNVLVQDVTTLPSETRGFETETYAYMSHGGVVMRDVGNNILGWIDVVA